VRSCVCVVLSEHFGEFATYVRHSFRSYDRMANEIIRNFSVLMLFWRRTDVVHDAIHNRGGNLFAFIGFEIMSTI
jgi:hypothetical protein